MIYYYAAVIGNNSVEKVVPIEEEFVNINTDQRGPDDNVEGLKQLHDFQLDRPLSSSADSQTRWILAKKGNEIVRGNFPSVGFDYIKELDIFIEPRFSRHWTVNTETYRWDPPYPMPELTEQQISDDYRYVWDDEQHDLNSNGWVLLQE